MRILIPVVCIAALLAGESHAQQQQPESERAEPERALELALSDEAVQLRYFTDAEIRAQRTSRMFYTVFLSEERDVVGSAALLVDTDLDLLPRLTIQVGPQVYAGLLSEENEDAFALAVGVQLRYALVRSRGINIIGHAFGSPDVLTFGSADNLFDYEARAEMPLANRLIGFAGYRWFELDLVDRQERTLQNELFVGVRWLLE